MNRLLLVLVICGFIITVAPGFSFATDPSNCVIYDVPPGEIESLFGKIPASQLTQQDSLAISSYRFTGDTLKLVAILLDWSNRRGTYSKETFDSLLFSRNVFPGGSVADYFYEVSYGQVNMVGEVIDWYTDGTYPGYFDFYFFQSLFSILDPVIDYSQFDGDHDGNVDAATIIRSGNGKEDSQDDNDIWSGAVNYTPGHGLGPFDGVYIMGWNTCPETRPLRDSLYPPGFSGVNTLNRISVFCHELGHNVGLPDLYDYDEKLNTTTYYTPNDANDHPINSEQCIMGYGGYGLLSIGAGVPTHFCGWSKKQLGWINPIGLTGDTHIVINNIETTKDNSLYLLPVKPEEGEYFLLEYRNPRSTTKFNKIDSDFSCYFWPHLTYGGDTLDRGLQIIHVHDSLGVPYWRINDGTPTYLHYTVVVEDAGYNPARDASFNPEGHVTDSAQWWYPYETRKAAPFSNDVQFQNLFSPTTYPNSDGYFGPSGIIVRVDSIIDDKLYAYVYVPIPAFSLLSPQNNLYIPYIVTLDWMDASLSGGIRYDLYISTSPAFHPDSIVVYDSLISSQFTDTLEIDRYYWKVRAYNSSIERWSDQTWTFVSAKRGDANADKILTVTDVIYLVNYLFRGGNTPIPESLVGDVNCDGKISVSDVVYLINYLFKGGPPPC
jgi:M6 family metalloprotease-like protein